MRTAPLEASCGTVYGVALNDRLLLERLEGQLDQPPYKAPPRAPILYIKTRNTYADGGARVAVPADPGVVRIEATLGAVIGQRATRRSAADALDAVAGYRIVSDVTLPHDNYYRPAIRQRCRDGFCPMSAALEIPAGFDPDRAVVRVDVDGKAVHRWTLATLVRPLARLIADVTEFMTLEAGDVLLVGAGDAAPLARPGQRVRIEIEGLGVLEHSLVAEVGAGT